MANCSNCNANVGCSCQLVNGLCAACRVAVNKVQNFIETCLHQD